MQDKTILFSKLAGEYKNIESILGPHGHRQQLHHSFPFELGQEINNKLSVHFNSLKSMIPELYSDISLREVPTPTESGQIYRSFFETLKRDIDYVFEINSHAAAFESKPSNGTRRIFISHGSSKDWMKVQSYLERDLNISTLELAQEPNKGRTVLQKLFEESDKCSFSVVVMTGDDIISDEEVQARENVMHEIGFFQGKFGLDKVCLLYEEGVNIPSNIHGLVYIPFPKNVVEATFGALAREVKVV
ncbi:TIR domain-containing protein [Sediminibacterium sp.]|uniref:TIR domain-containing protein n=1 Tax=Sediminibacterium sp. TaxID=1917865 RepID=UPI003F6A0A0B